MVRTGKGFTRATLVVIAGLTVLAVASHFLVDWLWFSAIGYLDVFWIILTTKALLFITVVLASTAILGVNGWLALRFTPQPKTSLSLPFEWQAVPNPPSAPDFSEHARRHLPVLIAAAAGVLGFLTAAVEMSSWDVVLRFLFQVPFAQSDPVYGKNIGFFLFSLPVYLAVKNWMLLTTILSGLIAGAVHWVRGGIVWHVRRLSMTPAALAHGSVLLAIFFAVKAWSYYLDRFLLLYGDNGVVVGASYTDLTIELPVLWVLVGLSFVASVAAWIGPMTAVALTALAPPAQTFRRGRGLCRWVGLTLHHGPGPLGPTAYKFVARCCATVRAATWVSAAKVSAPPYGRPCIRTGHG